MSIVDPDGYSINDTAANIAAVVDGPTQLANLDLALGSAKLSSSQPNAQVALNVTDGNVVSLTGVSAAVAAADDAMSIVDPNGYAVNDTAGGIAAAVDDPNQLAYLDLALGSAKLSSNQPNAQVALNVTDGNVLSLAGVAAAEAAAGDAMSIVDPNGYAVSDTAGAIAAAVDDPNQLAKLDLALGSAKLSSDQPNAEVALNVTDGNVLSLTGVSAAQRWRRRTTRCRSLTPTATRSTTQRAISRRW
jgi:hypothetical protein